MSKQTWGLELAANVFYQHQYWHHNTSSLLWPLSGLSTLTTLPVIRKTKLSVLVESDVPLSNQLTWVTSLFVSAELLLFLDFDVSVTVSGMWCLLHLVDRGIPISFNFFWPLLIWKLLSYLSLECESCSLFIFLWCIVDSLLNTRVGLSCLHLMTSLFHGVHIWTMSQKSWTEKLARIWNKSSTNNINCCHHFVLSTLTTPSSLISLYFFNIAGMMDLYVGGQQPFQTTKASGNVIVDEFEIVGSKYLGRY